MTYVPMPFRELKPLPEEEDGNYHTLAGFVMMQLGRVPQVSDYFTWEGWRIEVVSGNTYIRPAEWRNKET